MDYTDVYGVTSKGEQELRGSVTTISPPEVELLVRLDGVLTLAQIRQGMSAAALETDRKSTRLNSSHIQKSRMPSSA